MNARRWTKYLGSLAVGVSLLLSACGSDAPEPDSATVATQPAETPAPTPEPAPEPTVDTQQFPDGYPKVVKVSSLPDQVRSWYEMGESTEAVAIAEGVWTELPPGAEMVDAIAAGTLDGFCGSIKAYERKYAAGEEHGGTCW